MIKPQSVIALLSVLLSPLSYGGYPNLADTPFDDHGNNVHDTDNIVKSAIEKQHLIPLRYNEKFKKSSADIFKEVDTISEFELNAYVNASLVRGIQKIAGEFACATYRHYSDKPETSACNGRVANEKIIEGEPFQQGQFVRERLKTTLNNLSKPSRSYDLYLPSAEEKPLDIFWGAAHKLGSFGIDDIDSESMVLTVYIDAFKVSRDGQRDSKVTEKEQIVMVVLPRASDLGKQSNEQAARDYAISHAKVLVPVYPN